MALTDDFRMFGKEEHEYAGVRELVLEISPKNDRVAEIPLLELPVFDPEEQRYEVLEVGPFPLTVEAGGEDGLTTELATEEELLNDLETIREVLPPASAPVAPVLEPPITAWISPLASIPAPSCLVVRWAKARRTTTRTAWLGSRSSWTVPVKAPSWVSVPSMR